MFSVQLFLHTLAHVSTVLVKLNVDHINRWIYFFHHTS